jgi:cytochrome c oxidase subunit 2
MNSEKNRSLAPFLLAALLVLLVAVTTYVFVSQKYSPPPPITAEGRAIDHQYDLTLAVTAVAFILSQLGLAFVVFRFRDHGQRASYSHGNNTLELLWTGVTAVVFIGLGLLGGRAWANSRALPDTPDLVRIEITESQFVFNFRYPGPDGKFGRIDPKQIDASTGNPLGLDSSDPAGADDLVLPTLTIPVDRQVEFLIRSQDVIHNFFVRELRLQQDAVPGLIVALRVKADKIGRYEIVCTQLCGLGHSNMHTYLSVVSAEDYATFLKNGGD